jgi:hypothetical protein
MSTKNAGRFLIAICLDRTGSMATYRDQTVSGFNEFLHQQQADPIGEAWVSLTLFDRPMNDNDIEERFVAHPIAEIPDLGTPGNPYEPRGNTPLYDAVGLTIRSCEEVAKNYDRVLFVIQTDGAENCSRDWTPATIFDLITAKREQGWAFVFLGADQDAFAAGHALGVAAGSTMGYASSRSEDAFAAVSTATSLYRSRRGSTADSFFQGASTTTSSSPATVAGASTPTVAAASKKPAKRPNTNKRSVK